LISTPGYCVFAASGRTDAYPNEPPSLLIGGAFQTVGGLSDRQRAELIGLFNR